LKWKKIFEAPKNWEINLSKKRIIVLAFVLFIMGLLLLPHLSDILSARQEYVAGQNTAKQDSLTDTTKLFYRLYGQDAVNALKDKLTTQDAGICLDIDPKKVKVIILETDVEAIKRIGPQIDIWAINKLIGNRFSCFLDIPLNVPYLESPLKNEFVTMYTTGVYDGPTKTIEPKYYITKPSTYPIYTTYEVGADDKTLIEINKDRYGRKLKPYIGYIFVPRSVAMSLRSDYKNHFEIVPPEDLKKIEEYLGIEMPEETSYSQVHDQGLVDALNIGDVQIIGRDAAYKTVLWGKVIATRFIKTYSGWYGSASQSEKETHLYVASQGDITSVRYFEIRLKDISLDVDKKDKDGNYVLKESTRDLLTQRKLLFSFSKNVKIINARSGGEVGDIMSIFIPREQAELLSVAIETTCWTEGMHSLFGGQVEFDNEALFNPEMGKPIYTKDGESVMEWGALTINVDYSKISSAMEYLTFVIALKFPDPQSQSKLMENIDKHILTSSKEINTIEFWAYADDMCNNIWAYKELSNGRYGYGIVSPTETNQRNQIWVPIIDRKFTETNVEYYIDFYTFAVPKDSFESMVKDREKPDREKLAESIVSSSTFGIQLQAGQSYRTSTETKDSCREWVSKWMPGMFKNLGYTYCTVRKMFHGVAVAVKNLSSIVLGGGPAATIRIARENGGSLAVAVLLSSIMYMAFLLALLIIIVGLVGMNLDMAWFGVRIELFLIVFSYLQILIGDTFKTPYGMFSLVRDFFNIFYKFVYSIFESMISGNPFMWGVVAVAIIFFWLFVGRGK